MRYSYDTDAALMVEEVLREMFWPYYPEYRLLQAYFGEGMTHKDIADELGVSRSAVTKRRMPMAERIFSEQWGLLIRRC